MVAASDFLVSWAGSDESGSGAGVGSFDVYVAIDRGPFSLWLPQTPLAESVYHGTPGHVYAFYSQARDNVGHIEAPPASPDAQTEVAARVEIVGQDSQSHKPGWTWTEADGDVVKPVYSGRQGYAAFCFDTADRLQLVELHNTNASSSLELVVKNPKQGGDGRVSVGRITADAAFKTLKFGSVNLAGVGLSFAGPVPTPPAW